MLYEQYKKQAMNDLKNYHELKTNIKTLGQRIRFLRRSDLYTGIGAEEKVMMTREGDSLMVRHLSQLEEMEKQLKYSRLYLDGIDNALSMLSQRDRDNLTSFYINRQRRSVTKLAEDTFSDRSWLYRKAQRSLDRYIEAFFCVSVDELQKKTS